MASFWSLDGGDDGYDDDDEYDPRPYCGGFDLYLTYGKSIPPSDETCYPISGNTGDFHYYERPKYDFSPESSYGFSRSDHYASKPISYYSYGGEEYLWHTDDKEEEAPKYNLKPVDVESSNRYSYGANDEEEEAPKYNLQPVESSNRYSYGADDEVEEAPKYRTSHIHNRAYLFESSDSDEIKSGKELQKSTEQRFLIKQNKDLWQNDVTTVSYTDLQKATSDFSDSNKLGQGGFGKVYKGHLRGTEVAIKILLSPGDADQVKAFHREVNILSRVSHPHLVQLIGVCPEKFARPSIYGWRNFGRPPSLQRHSMARPYPRCC